MGRRGPPPTPTAKLRLTGTWRSNDRSDEPQIQPVATPKPPATISSQGRRIWNQYAPVLSGSGILTPADLRIFAQYCNVSAEWRRLELWIAKHGHTYWDEGRQYQHSESRLWVQLGEQIIRLSRELGLSPAARASLKVEKPKQVEDKKARYLRKSG